MQRSVILDASGLPLGFFTDDALPAAPAGAVAISEATYRALLAAPGRAALQNGAVVPFAPPADIAAYIAAAHAALRDGGVTVGGMRIKTDAESRGLIDGAYALSQAQPDSAIDFKAASGWVSINSQTMQTVAVAVGQWVQACYSAYRRLDEGRTAGTITTPAQVDAAFAAVALPTS